MTFAMIRRPLLLARFVAKGNNSTRLATIATAAQQPRSPLSHAASTGPAAGTATTSSTATSRYSHLAASTSVASFSSNVPQRFLSSSSDSSSLCPKQIQVRLNEFQDLFVEARLCIDDVKDSIGTVYFEDDSEEAREAVQAAIDCFEQLTGEITDIDEKNKVLRSNGLKVEQLKGELEMTLNEHDDHH